MEMTPREPGRGAEQRSASGGVCLCSFSVFTCLEKSATIEPETMYPAVIVQL